jgi:hypothetical protein
VPGEVYLAQGVGLNFGDYAHDASSGLQYMVMQQGFWQDGCEAVHFLSLHKTGL